MTRARQGRNNNIQHTTATIYLFISNGISSNGLTATLNSRTGELFMIDIEFINLIIALFLPKIQGETQGSRFLFKGGKM
jgi:hypothetical protein